MRRVRRAAVACVAAVALSVVSSGQVNHPGVTGGMGVTYLSSNDIVNLVNSTSGAVEQIPQFRAGAEFFGAISIPIDEDWIVKLDYGYQITSYNIATIFETAQYTVTQHCPTLIVERVVVDRGVFNVGVGAGAGYHFGTLTEKYSYVDNSYSGRGPGFILEVEGNTALGEHLYIHLGANARWELIGGVTDANGTPPGGTLTGGDPTLNSVGVGARLGFTYYVF